MKIDGYQLFRLSPQIWKSVRLEDIVATAKDMEEMGLLRSPFDKFAIEVPWEFMNLMSDEELTENDKIYSKAIVMFEYEMSDTELPNGSIKQSPSKLYMTGLDDNHRVVIPRKNVIEYISIKNGKVDDIELASEMVTMAHSLNMILTVLLATKNHQADTMVNRNLLAGKSNKKNAYRKNYPYTTTISVGKITESHVGDGDDPRTVRPHLRRGHIRTQRYGPDRVFEKKIFIEPVFVNASLGWIAKREAYNVSSKAWLDSRANVS